MPKDLLQLIDLYNTSTNPVTKCSYRQCIRDRVSRSPELQLYRYIGYLVTPTYGGNRYACTNTKG